MHVVEEIRLDAVLCQHSRRRPREFLGFAPRVVGNDDAAFDGVLSEFLNKLGKPLRGAHDGVDVHHVHAVADDAAHPRGAEFQLAAEAVFLRLFVARDFL